MWLCPWFLYNIGLCSSSGGGCCSDQSFAASNGVCFLPADSGPCNDQYDLRWYHDLRTGSCRQFMYGGCGGNTNNFLTKSKCVEACNVFPTDAGQFAQHPKVYLIHVRFYSSCATEKHVKHFCGVESMLFDRRVAGSNPALAAM